MFKNNNGKILFSGPILDRVGRQITPGSIIIYGHALGRSATLRIGKVIKIICQITPAYNNPYANYPEQREYRVTVQGIDDDFVDYNKPDHRRPTLLTKKSTLQFPHRMMVLDETNLPEEFRKLLSTVEVEKL